MTHEFPAVSEALARLCHSEPPCPPCSLPPLFPPSSSSVSSISYFSSVWLLFHSSVSLSSCVLPLSFHSPSSIFCTYLPSLHRSHPSSSASLSLPSAYLPILLSVSCVFSLHLIILLLFFVFRYSLHVPFSFTPLSFILVYVYHFLNYHFVLLL